MRQHATRPRLLFYVQHLLGIGHLVRALRIARALDESFALTLVCGGVLPEGLADPSLDLRQLAPVKAGADGFSALAHPDGRPFTSADQDARRDALLSIFAELRPDILVTEAFPFGRRQMRFELLPLLAAASAQRPRPLVATSIRDILQESRKPGRAEETAALVERHFDLVLVHGDPAMAVIEATFPLAARFADRIAYTGLVGPHAAPPPTAVGGPAHAVVISAGGGAVGTKLLQASLLARPATRFANRPWLVVAGPNLPEGDMDALRPLARESVEIARFVPDLPVRLGRAEVSVSQAGYNTVADLIAARCRAVLVPFAAGGETEQTVRARTLAARGLAVHLPESALGPAAVAAAIEAAAGLPAPGNGIGLDGAARTAAILRERFSAFRSA